jgi:hypothetical protein
VAYDFFLKKIGGVRITSTKLATCQVVTSHVETELGTSIEVNFCIQLVLDIYLPYRTMLALFILPSIRFSCINSDSSCSLSVKGKDFFLVEGKKGSELSSNFFGFKL